MRNPSVLFVTALCLTLSAACGKSDKTTPAPAPAAPKMTTASFGVPECDDYVRKYLACIDTKVPEAQRAQIRQALAQTEAAWQDWLKQVQNDAEKAALAQGCKSATEAARQAMSGYGCTF